MSTKIIELSWNEETTGVCPVCLLPAAALIYRDSGKIWIRQDCLRHGQNKALLASDADEYIRLRQYVPPRVSGCCCGPGDTCDTGKPPVCVLLIEITQACNLSCPTCYADAHGHEFMSIDEVRRRLDQFFTGQPLLDVLMISGGEPTIHPQLIEILDLALSYPINRVLINTNGLRLAQPCGLVEKLATHRKQIELYLSFSSFQPDVHTHLYGKVLLEQKAGAFDAAEREGLFVNLVAAVESKVNDHELGELLRFALSKPNIVGLILQPVMQNGRYTNDYNPEDRATLTSVIADLTSQSSGMLVPSDFVGLPCSHPDCAALTYGFLNKERTEITPLPRSLDISRYLDLFADRISFSGLIASAFSRLLSDIKAGDGRTAIRDLIGVFRLPAFRGLLPLFGHPELVASRVFRIVVKPFMDAHTYDAHRSDQCCTKVIDENGEAISFCDYNIFQRGVKNEPRGMALPMVKQ